MNPKPIPSAPLRSVDVEAIRDRLATIQPEALAFMVSVKTMRGFLAEIDRLRASARDAAEWRCFHCDEVFTDEASAREHFGAEIYRDAACRFPVGADIKHIRGLEARVAQLQRENERLDNDARLWHEAEADRIRRIGNREWWQELDALHGERLVLQERIAELASARDAEEPKESQMEPLNLPSPAHSFDARLWAESFVAHIAQRPSIATDEGAMLAWFASAIMRGFDEAERRRDAQDYQLLGFLSGEIPELHHVEVPRIVEAYKAFLNTRDPDSLESRQRAGSALSSVAAATKEETKKNDDDHTRP